MHPEILATMARQHGLVTRAQAVALGLDPDRVDRRVRDGEWVVVRRGVYAGADLAAAATSWVDRRLLADRAASLRITRPHVMSHESAAAELGLTILRPPTTYTHVTRPGVVGSHLRHGVKHHLAPHRPDQVLVVDGRAVLDHARTAVDVAREHGHPHGVVACDAALRAGATTADLRAAEAAMAYWPHVTRVRDAIDLSDAGADSPGETLTRLLVTEIGAGRPQTQFGLTRDGRTVWCDLRLGRHVVEFDGRAKYQRVDEGGYALTSADEVVWREKQRQDWVMGFELGMSRVVWTDLFGPRRRTTLERVRREHAATCARYGTSVDDLTPYLARGPRPRPVLRAA